MATLMRVGDLTLRTIFPWGVGPVFTGCPWVFSNGRSISPVGSQSYAGYLITPSPGLFVCGKPVAIHPGLCTEGFTYIGDMQTVIT